MTVPRIGYVTYRPDVGGLLRNVGDRVIFQGVKNLVTAAIGRHNVIELDFDTSGIPERDLDLLIFCGTPQISAFTAPQPIHRKIIAALSDKKIPTLNIGAGSFFFNNQHQEDFIRQLQGGERARVFSHYAGFDLFTVRDKPALEAMKELGVRAELLPCPGFFSTLEVPRTSQFRKLISPLGSTSTYWDQYRGSIFELYADIMREFPEFSFLAHDQSDVELLESIGADYHVCEREDEFLKLLAECSDLLTFRVHSALPAQSLGARVLLVGFDNRLRMAQETGVPLQYLDLLGGSVTGRQLRSRFESIVPDKAKTRTVLTRARSKYVKLLKTVTHTRLERSAAARAVRQSSRAQGGPPPEFFFTMEKDVEVPATLMSTHHRIVRAGADQVTIELTPGNRTAFFGPYIRLLRGQYELTMTLDASGAEGLTDLDLVVRYSTGEEFVHRHVEVGSQKRQGLCLEFTHLRETPKIEVQVFLLNELPSPVGTLTLADLKLRRVAEVVSVPPVEEFSLGKEPVPAEAA